ncbi:MAG: hypothetical protein FWG57_02600 [Endomicrobia bacterium]|nr:hypothetical protein [Endomicrobiia bacterium]
MKKVFAVLCVMFAAVCCVSFAYAISVDNFDDFNAELLVSSPSYSISLSSDIIVSGTINVQGADILEILGEGFTIDGNEFGSVFSVSDSKELSFSTMTLTNFQNFTASSDTHSFGGVLNNDGIFNVEYSTFSGNSAVNESLETDAKAYGGAIYNSSSGTVNILNSSFLNNSVSASSGTARGGAIYNEGVLDITADGGNVEFTGNRATGASNAIHNAGEVNFRVNNDDNMIIINDAITGDGGTINIINASTNSIIAINNSLTGNTINLQSGTLRLGIFDGIKDPENEGTYLTAQSRGSIGTSALRNDFFMYDGSCLDMRNTRSDDIVYVTTFSVVSGTAALKIDVDLDKLRSDTININGEVPGNGKLVFYGMRILSDFTAGVSGDIRIFTGSVSTDVAKYIEDVNFFTYGSNTVYQVTKGSDDYSLNFLLLRYSTDTFQDAVDVGTGTRNYVLENDYYLPSSFNPVLSTGTLLLDGYGADGKPVTINGNQVSNIFRLENTDTYLEAKNLIITNAKAEEGGAVYNAGSAAFTNVTFEKNIAESTSAIAQGGAVYNLGISTFSNVTFNENIVKSTSTAAQGGAIYNESVLKLYDSSFIGNVAEGTGTAGGAIYSSSGIVNIIANGANVEFKDNKAGGISNAIHASSGAKINLNAVLGKTIFFYDAITSDGNDNIININASSDDDSTVGALSAKSLTPRTGGIIYLDADMSQFGNLNSSSGNTVNLYGGTLQLGKNVTFFEDVTFNMYAGSRIDMTNGQTGDNIAVTDFNLPDTGNAYLSIDVDLNKGEIDTLIGTALNNNSGRLVIDGFKVLNDMRNIGNRIVVQIADDGNLQNALMLASPKEEILGPVFTYFVSYNGGNLEFEYAFDFNPSIFIAPITLQTGGYLGQLNSYEQAFAMIDEAVSYEGAQGLWLRPYAYNEDVKLNKNLTVSNEAYGAYMGYNSAPSDIGRDFSGVFSIYGAYNASYQTYKNDTEITQGGGLLGATAVLFKERFFTAITANMGLINEHGKGKYGEDHFMMYTRGIAVKTGYNIHLDGREKYALQPSLDLSYSMVDIAPYKNTAGVEVNVGRFAPFHVEPGLKLSADLKKGMTSFVNVNMTWTLMGDTDCTANGIELPVMSIDPYMQYGVGLRKAFSEAISAGAELYGRSLGRTGVGGQMSVRWSF